MINRPFKTTVNIPTLKRLADASIFATPRDPVDRIVQSSYDVDTFHMLMKILKFEVQAHNAWLQKCVGIVNANAWAQQQHKLEFNKPAVKAVTGYWNGCAQLMCVSVGRPEETINDSMEYKKNHIITKCHCWNGQPL